MKFSESTMKDFLDRASQMYYQGSPILSDAEFDSLARKYNYNVVGHSITDGVPHLFKMYSLQKIFTEADLPDEDMVCTPKLDGAAVSLTYVEGTLAMALTRGDGNLGKDITEKMLVLAPSFIPFDGTVQITGEVVAPSSIPNARNYASGSLNLKDIDEFRERCLVFVAYDAQVDNISIHDTYTDTLRELRSYYFRTVDTFDTEDYPTDGLVYRVRSNKTFEKLGYTAHHPRGAFALKEIAAGVVTKLLDVVWQVGKSGVVSPVAILEPVNINDAIVSRATLHNIQYIESLELEIGCNVEVIRSGEIIPRILRRVD